MRGIPPQLTSIITVGLLVLPSCALANLGDTIEQSRNRNGPPLGEIKAGSKTLLIYKMPQGKLTEIFNADGICIESEAEISPEARAEVIRLSKPNIQSSPTPKTKANASPQPRIVQIPPEEKAKRPDMQPIEEQQPIVALAPWKNGFPPVLAGIALASIVGGIIFFLRRKIEPAQDSASAVTEIKAYCDFEQRRHEQKPMQQSQQNPDSKYYKDYPAA